MAMGPPGDVEGRGEYETGRVICEICGEGVSFRDEGTGGFTLKHWEAHRAACASNNHVSESSTAAIRLPPTHPSHLPPSSATMQHILQHHPTSSPDMPILPMSNKRRRAKRSEEERIAYLRNDEHVAQFEAYRVLCGNCHKWIRLRPNSTYCSIPWDAHRKSCLARKGPGSRRGKKTKNPLPALPPDPRVAYFAKDPDVRKYEGDRVLCNLCVRWVSLVENGKNATTALEVQPQIPSPKKAKQVKRKEIENYDEEEDAEEEEDEDEDAEGDDESEEDKEVGEGHTEGVEESDEVIKRWVQHKQECRANGGSSKPSTSSTPSPPPSNGRRLNAEQRAAYLRADPLIAHVEPNRVFCSVCEKWVQLRQDSTYCAYPWVMHRGKCVKRKERRLEKIEEARARMAEVVSAPASEAARRPGLARGSIVLYPHLALVPPLHHVREHGRPDADGTGRVS
ncbi:hypothetical protein OE88DRAFT_518359 [Heliocybe sulcata]|uniref:Uncharacterized protein n=1 Tax=Heliocybe sulcata TaxID=5364 RepID=A0A5C3MTU2_9AGAM|nr:hypothetical protein OE88DRAFT_518359 [Heliocybe sulcata]